MVWQQAPRPSECEGSGNRSPSAKISFSAVAVFRVPVDRPEIVRLGVGASPEAPPVAPKIDWMKEVCCYPRGFLSHGPCSRTFRRYSLFLFFYFDVTLLIVDTLM